MPPSSDQETSSLGTNVQPRVTQKQASSAVHIPTKKERKHGAAKANSGAAAAMSFNTKMSDSAKPPSPALTPRDSPPERPSAMADQLPGTTSNVTSPLLDALASSAFRPSPSQNTNDWARNLPQYSTSPGNLITLSDSPPTQPSSYNDDRTNFGGWQYRERGYPSSPFHSASPPLPSRRPLSFHMEGHRGFDPYGNHQNMYNRKPSLAGSPGPNVGGQPPLPHQYQPLFGGPFSLDMRLQASGLRAGSHGYFCGFETLSAVSTANVLKPFESVVLSGYEGGLDVMGVSKHGLEEVEKVGCITDLRGGVYNAKILQCHVGCEPRETSPVIAVVVHGPAISANASNPSHDAATAEIDTKSDSGANTVHPSEESRCASPTSLGNMITHYQTTVELYALSENKHISTLLSLPAVSVGPVPFGSSLFAAPPPSSALSLSSDAGTLIVSSGMTGEVWIFSHSHDETELPFRMRCLGKIWAATQVGLTRDLSGPALNDEAEAASFAQSVQAAIVSLKGRWLAYSPAITTKQSSLRATVHCLTPNAKCHGLSTYSPPPLPTINCLTDVEDTEKPMSQYGRMMTQTAVKGAKWVGEQGVSAWNSYWKSPPTVSQPNTWHGGNALPEYGTQFPPTHGEDIPANLVPPKSSLVSIIDLEKLMNSRTASSAEPPHPSATFKTPLGCSFLSFAPSGLALFTASSKGDVQVVWDLMRMLHTKSSVLQSRHPAGVLGVHVRQIAVWTRLTVAKIVDVIWTLPGGGRIAMITERGTVHFLELPSNAFAWPPPRRRIFKPQQSPQAESAEAQRSAKTIASSAVNAAKGLVGFAQPFMNKRPRGMSASATAVGMTASLGYGVRAGISNSFDGITGAIQNMKMAAEGRLHLPEASGSLRSGCVKWFGSQRGDCVAVILNGVVKIYSIKVKRSNSKSGKSYLSIGSRPIEKRLPLIPSIRISPAVSRTLGLSETIESTDTYDRSRWVLGRRAAVNAGKSIVAEDSTPQAEIQTNAPYQPFHTDHRVALFIFDDIVPNHVPQLPPPTIEVNEPLPSASTLLEPVDQPKSKKKTKSPARNIQVSLPAPTPVDQPVAEDNPWVFGCPIATIKLDIGSSEEDEAVSTSGHILPSSAMEYVTSQLGVDPNDPFVVTTITTRPRHHAQRNAAAGLEDGEFEEEDDWLVYDFASERV